jgi:hypothetical protein
MAYLESVFPGRLISKRFWPPRSPDLSPQAIPAEVFMVIINCVGSVVVSVLSTGPKVRGFKPRRDRFLRAIIRSTSSVEQEVKGRSHVVRFYSMLKIR